MNQEEVADFLAESRIAVMATINRDGMPQLTANWYYYDGRVVTFITTKERLKYLNLKRDNRMSVCIYAAPMASDYVVIKGRAKLKDQDMWDEARRIMARYVPEHEIDQHLELWKTQPRVLVTVTPTRISSRRRQGSELLLWSVLGSTVRFLPGIPVDNPRREAVSQAVGHLHGACSVAVLALTDIAQDVNCPASARVSAARTVLEMAIKGVELEDLAARLEHLELQVTRV